MSLGRTNIPYLDRLWHPTTGCSFGCLTCWARPLICDRLAGTMKGLPVDCARCGGTGCPSCEDHGINAGDPFSPTFHPDRLADPLRARKPQVIGVSFLGDLFDPAITDAQIAAVFGVMAAAPQHTFVVLTKRAERMQRWSEWVESASQRSGQFFTEEDQDWRRAQLLLSASMRSGVEHRIRKTDKTSLAGVYQYSGPWPLPSVWLGVSVTNQADADERIPRLLRTPAEHRWISAEPLVGAVDLAKYLEPWTCSVCDFHGSRSDSLVVGEDDGNDGVRCCPKCENDEYWLPDGGYKFDVESRVDLVIAGGESGPNARPCHPDWARSLRDQCEDTGVPFNFKQWGEWAPFDYLGAPDGKVIVEGEVEWGKVGTKAAGRLLDGQIHNALPWAVKP